MLSPVSKSLWKGDKILPSLSLKTLKLAHLLKKILKNIPTLNKKHDARLGRIFINPSPNFPIRDIMVDMSKLKPEFLITPENLDAYLQKFPKEVKELANPNFWKGKRVFVTGVSGFVGSHLAEKLIEYGCEVHGLVRRHSTPEYPNIRHIMDKIHLHEGNLDNFDSMLNIMERVEPHIIFHLGAQSFVPTSFRSPTETYTTNVIGTSNVLEAIRKLEIPVEAIQVACSSEEYGKVDEENAPIHEDVPLRPMSPYGASKVATDVLARSHFNMYGLPTIVTRGFNHSGSRRGLQFVTSVIARQVARNLVKGGKDIVIGKPDSIRDFTHVDDMIQGYMLGVEKGRRGEPYNLGHGFGITIENLAKVAAKINGIENPNIIIDKRRFRPAEVDLLICDYSKAKRELGYFPQRPISVAIQDAVNHFKNNTHLLDVERH